MRARRMNAELANLTKEIGRIAQSRQGSVEWMMGINERRIVQEIKAIANLEHRYNPYNSSWGLVLEYCKQLLEGEKQ